MQASRENNGPLEDRLRNMIISNTENNGSAPSASLATAPYLASQDRFVTRDDASPSDEAIAAKPSGPSPKQPARRRPNQAERRQMSAQLSIPLDQAYNNTPGRPGQHHGGGYNRRQHAQPHERHVPFQNPGYQGSPGSNNPLAGQGRHQQSFSYGGPAGPPGSRYERPAHSGQGIGFMRRGSQGPVLPFDSNASRAPRTPAALFSPSRQFHVKPEDMQAQVALLESLSDTIVANAEIEHDEIMEKEGFRARIEHVCQQAIAQYEIEQNGHRGFPLQSVQLRCFGSLMSGFATKASDMDLGLLSPLSIPQPDEPGSPIPRLVEKAFLDLGLGARLLTRTRVPIIKLCENPPDKLRQDLLREREKWEKGIDDELEPADDEGHDEPIPVPPRGVGELDESKQGHAHQDSEISRQLEPEKYHAKLASLTQQDKASLSSYFGLSKRLLRRLGGRDITHSNASEFSEDDFKILNDVCRALIQGLADKSLKKRLGGYQSLSFLLQDEMPSKYPSSRSLAGVFTQIEGEKLAMVWDSRQVREKDDDLEKLAQSCIQGWKDLQQKPASFGVSPLTYNKELQVSADQLRRIPSLQIAQLEQDQFESAAQYHYRSIKLLLELGGNDSYDFANPTASNVLSAVMKQYASGVRQEDIRTQVVAFAQKPEVRSLRAVARRHKSLQVASEFEKAIEKGLYARKEAEDIQTYILLLRRPLELVPQDKHFDFVAPVTSNDVALLNRIRRLRNPAELGPNQPRDPYRDGLEFPKTGAGVQCDINFSAHLALQNTALLRCYSHTDPRVRPLVLFVKHWAKVRGINTPYRGTLSSYGYVLMMLHYLVNVAQPFVCPNLQELVPPPDPNLTPQQVEETTRCKGCDIRFWRDENDIIRLAQANSLNQNQEPIGQLLRGFFEYYAQNNMMSTVPCRGFDWGRDVLSLRTHGGLRTKQEKGWVGAKTTLVMQQQQQQQETRPPPGTFDAAPGQQANPKSPAADGEADSQQPQSLPTAPTAASAGVAKAKPAEFKEVRHRYLCAIEDPFELDHNVARTVTHNGIVAIRDEFRRAWRIIKGAGKGPGPQQQQEELLADATGDDEGRAGKAFSALLEEIHGNHVF